MSVSVCWNRQENKFDTVYFEPLHEVRTKLIMFILGRGRSKNKVDDVCFELLDVLEES